MVNTRVWLAIVLVLLIGNSTWQVQRLINMNRRVLETNKQLLDANAKVIEANGRLNEANARLNSHLRRLFGLPPFGPLPEEPTAQPDGTLG
jgi:hypothetical protein